MLDYGGAKGKGTITKATTGLLYMKPDNWTEMGRFKFEETGHGTVNLVPCQFSLLSPANKEPDKEPDKEPTEEKSVAKYKVGDKIRVLQDGPIGASMLTGATGEILGIKPCPNRYSSIPQDEIVYQIKPTKKNPHYDTWDINETAMELVSEEKKPAPKPERKYKAGDELVITKDGANLANVRAGDVVTITPSQSLGGLSYDVVGKDGCWWCINEEYMKPVPQFKVGDRAIILQDHPISSMFLTGDLVKIVSVYGDSNGYAVGGDRVYRVEGEVRGIDAEQDVQEEAMKPAPEKVEEAKPVAPEEAKPEARFKVGDRVRITKGGALHAIVDEGDIGEVTDVRAADYGKRGYGTDEQIYLVKLSSRDEWDINEDALELAPEIAKKVEEAKPEPRFKVGDRVQITEDNPIGAGMKSDEEGLVVDIHPSDRGYKVDDVVYKVKPDREVPHQDTWDINEDAMKPAPEEAKPEARYKVGDRVCVTLCKERRNGTIKIVNPQYGNEYSYGVLPDDHHMSLYYKEKEITELTEEDLKPAAKFYVHERVNVPLGKTRRNGIITRIHKTHGDGQGYDVLIDGHDCFKCYCEKSISKLIVEDSKPTAKQENPMLIKNPSTKGVWSLLGAGHRFDSLVRVRLCVKHPNHELKEDGKLLGWGDNFYENGIYDSVLDVFLPDNVNPADYTLEEMCAISEKVGKVFPPKCKECEYCYQRAMPGSHYCADCVEKAKARTVRDSKRLAELRARKDELRARKVERRAARAPKVRAARRMIAVATLVAALGYAAVDTNTWKARSWVKGTLTYVGQMMKSIGDK
jgi:hypothetical protein